jgi:hypothetical protein
MNGMNPSLFNRSLSPPQFPVKYGCFQKLNAAGAVVVALPPLALAAAVPLPPATVAFPPAGAAAAGVVTFPPAAAAGALPSARPASGHASPAASRTSTPNRFANVKPR